VNKPLKLSSSKVPEGTVAFWVMKVAATTLGETGGDAVSNTRPLGATLGDLLTKPLAHGGLSFGRITSSLVIAIFILEATEGN
jgi:uncharacterized membrane-anchored protein